MSVEQRVEELAEMTVDLMVVMMAGHLVAQMGRLRDQTMVGDWVEVRAEYSVGPKALRSAAKMAVKWAHHSADCSVALTENRLVPSSAGNLECPMAVQWAMTRAEHSDYWKARWWECSTAAHSG